MDKQEMLDAIYNRVDHIEAELNEVEDLIFEVHRKSPNTPLGRTGMIDITEAMHRLTGIHNAVNEEMSHGHI